jgi:8-oxo-dGTP diphosphatase
MRKKQTVFRTVVTCIVRKNKKILVGLQKDFPKKIINIGGWIFPTGSVKINETPEMAAVRETKEETGILVKVIRPLGCKILKTKKEGKTFYTFSIWFECFPVLGSIKSTSEFLKVKWIKICQLDSYLSEKFKKMMPREVKKLFFELLIG